MMASLPDPAGAFCFPRRTPGFTLAELLISLAILGVIATFTIPKILSTQQSAQYNAIARDDMAAISAAFQRHKLAGLVNASTSFGDLTQYMNYVNYDTTGTNIDGVYTDPSSPCDGFTPCLRMHNGSVIQWSNGQLMSGATTLNAVWIHIDPNGLPDGSSTGPSKALPVFIYYDGRLTDEGHLLPGTVGFTADPSIIPPWFRW